jgi:hypothetical protein
MAASTQPSRQKLQDLLHASMHAQKDEERQVTLDDMPSETINAIFGYLRPHDLTKMACVSKKYRDITQSILWGSIELHRQDAHHDAYGLSTQNDICRSYLDEELYDDPWSYRDENCVDVKFHRHNAKFGTAVRKLYRTAGKSQAWARLALFVQHLCLTVTNKSPPQIWDMILSLPNLTTVEVIGEYSADNQGPPQPTSLRQPGACKIRNVRLRGYIPEEFVVEMCKASAATIVSLDLAAFLPPKIFVSDEEETEWPQQFSGLYEAPCAVPWFDQSSISFSSLTHLLLCRRGQFTGLYDGWDDDERETLDEIAYSPAELEQWASVLRSVRSTIVEVVLEQRPVRVKSLLERGSDRHDDKAYFIRGYDSFDSLFYRHILKSTFDDGEPWPRLKKLTLRGINLEDIEAETGETLSAFTERSLPGTFVQEVTGNYMFFNDNTGTIMSQHGADGLTPQLDISIYSEYGHLYLDNW